MSENKRSFCGNKIIYEFFLQEMLKTRYKGGKTLQEKWNASDDAPLNMWKQVCKMDRRKAYPPTATDVFELNRAITFFKPSIAKHIYQRFGATSVLDPCSGWGGRMLGAMACSPAGSVRYQGFDTNTDLKPVYDRMSVLLKSWGHTSDQSSVDFRSCLDADFSKLDYDCVLTSPPYYDLEIYPNQSDLPSETTWYRRFLMPMIARSYKYMKVGGHCCINISPEMYEKMLSFGFPPCQETVDFLQQKNTAQWGEGQGKQDFIYIWFKSPPLGGAC